MIRLDGVSKSFRRVQVLDRVSLDVERGGHVALVGANGAGKTTLIRCLLGEYHCQGEVAVGGLAPWEHRQEVLGRVGFVPQIPPPLRMPVGQLVRFASKLCGCEVEGIGAVGRRLGLDVDRVWRQPFSKLSGGQKQKLLIALALRDATDVLVLDEPAANLDPGARRSFFQLLEERGEAVTMILSIHRLDEVAGLVNRVVELDRGRVVRDERLPVGEGRGDGPEA